MRAITSSLFVFAMLAGCSKIPGTDANRIAGAEDRVRYTLADGDSAKFRNTIVAGDFVCGEVNGKNAFNAFVGFTPFAVPSKGDPVIMPERNGAIGIDGLIAAFPKVCRDALPAAKARYSEAMAALKPSPDLLTDSLDEQADAIERNEAAH